MVARFFYLSSLFIAGTVSSSAIAWLAIFPPLRQAVLILLAVTALVWFVVWGCDDAIAQYLNTTPMVIRAALLGTAFCVAIGGGLLWLLRII